MPPLDQLSDLVTRLGVVGLLAAALVGFYTGRVRSGRDYDKAVQERDDADDRIDRLITVLAALGIQAKS